MATESKANGSEAITYPKLSQRPVGQPIAHIYKARLSNFISPGQYESQNLLSMLDEGRATGGEHVKLFVYSVPDLARPTFKDATADENAFKSTKTGEQFGPSWSTHWFRIHLKIPPALVNKKHLEFHWDAGNEGLIWTEDGEPLQGLSGAGERIEWILPDAWRDGKEHIFYIEMACNKMFGNAPGTDDNQPPDPNMYYTLKKADIVAVNLEARALLIDFTLIADAAREFSPDSWESHKALRIANEIMDTFKPGSQESIVQCRKLAQGFLGSKVDSEKVYEGESEIISYGIGHCHIDTCWLWPWDETKRKIARSWANQCDLMDRYPEHRFACSQAQQFKWLKQYYPSLYERVKAKIDEGKFHPIGGSWVEHDTNMPSGESLIRQFLYGQRFFESHFGKRCTTFWLPDTFGYSGQLPQLCRLAGMSRFFTQKLSWNNINNFPHTTFNWVSLDGSQVLCHMTPAETYNAEADLGDLRRCLTQHKSMGQDPTSLLVFGKGDGGGGPTWQHLEKLRRCRGISDQVGVLPRVGMGLSVDDFFAQLQKKAENGANFATWYGELYFELHRGTYTTQANNKRNNRLAEIALHDIELLATITSLADSSYKYPKEAIDEMWEAVLLCQFHDCLPGSSIEMCYDESDVLYEKLFATGMKILTEIMERHGLSNSPSGPVFALNTLPWKRNEIVQLPTQEVKYGVVSTDDRPWAEVKVLPDTPSAATPSVSIQEIKPGFFVLENDQIRVQVEQGVITSLIYRPCDREVIAEGGKANQFVIFDDKPLNWQAWDVEVYHLNSRQELAVGQTKIGENSPYRVSVVTETKISERSWVKSTISLSPALEGELSYVEVQTEVEWRENMKFLKVEFPVSMTNKEASYETQFGVMTRPTHYNTTWDMAKFEVCCHKWADLSEHGFGVSILNDSKYGFATCGNLMRLSLLRAPKAPDANADMGRHHIRYAILPHEGALSQTTIRTAFNFNNPMKLLYANDLTKAAAAGPIPIRLTGSPSLVLDGVKRGEDDEDVSRGELPKREGRSVIVRIYDSLGGVSKGRIETTWPVKKVWKCNVLEDDEEEYKIENGKVDITLRAFEVATFRLQL
ncbi:hypothetical protein VTN77DRAFT_9531 [Rasamsonia byssochlamydoides]|uniref:uncharacterized protein n=1 Tax=Rasamsonia byssochlamydoides TaxID=89139 RepID=UPI003742A500